MWNSSIKCTEIKKESCFSILLAFIHPFYIILELLEIVLVSGLILHSIEKKQLPEVFFKKKVFLEISQNPQDNTCVRVSFLIKLRVCWSATLLRKILSRRCFPVNFVKFLRRPFYKEHLWWLLLIGVLYIFGSQYMIGRSFCLAVTIIPKLTVFMMINC